jgi:hypothetical protein
MCTSDHVKRDYGLAGGSSIASNTNLASPGKMRHLQLAKRTDEY